MKKQLVILLLIACSYLTQAQIPTNGLVGYYPFTGNANDMSGNSANGTVYGATLTTDRFGNANSAYSFNGSSNYIEAVSTNLPLGNSTRTISAWIKTNGTWYGRSIVNYGTVSDNLNFFMSCSGTNIGKIQAGEGAAYLIGTSTINTNIWKHVVVSYDATNWNIYVNGILENSTASSAINTIDSIFRIGRSVITNPSDGYYWLGSLDDIRIYNRLLTSNEMNALYNEGICSQSITVTDTLVINTNLTSLAPITYASTIKIFPNPSKDHITIDYGNYATLSGSTLKITNSIGTNVFTTPINQQTSFIDINTWTGNGIYFVYIINAQNQTVDIKKIVIQ